MKNDHTTTRSKKGAGSNPNNRAKAIEVASQLFLSQGYSYVSMDEVVKASGVSKSNIYYHFKNKEELLLAVVQFWIARYESDVYLLLSQRERSVEERITMFIASLSSGMEQRDYAWGCPFVTLYMQTPPDAPEVKETISRFLRELQPLVEKLLRQGIEQGEFRANIDPQSAASLFVTALEGSLVLAETSRDVSILERSARTFCQMLR